MTRVLLLLLLTGCSSQIDGNVPGFDRVSYVGDHDPRDVSMALHVWRSTLQWHTGDLADLTGVEIEESDLPGGLSGIERPGLLVIEPRGPLSSSALTHELTHEHLLRADGDPDHDHAAGPGPWTALHDAVIEEANDEMRRVGL